MNHKISTVNAAFTLARLCLGPGLLVLPYATLKGGLIFAPIGIILVALWNGFSCLIMIQCRHASEKIDIKIPTNISSTFSRVAYIGLGHIGTFLADFSLIVTLLGVCCSYQINFGTLIINLFGLNRHFSLDSMIIASSVFVSPFIFIDDLSILSSMSSIGLFCVILSAVAVLIYGYFLYGGQSNHISTNIQYNNSPASSATSAINSNFLLQPNYEPLLSEVNRNDGGYDTLHYFPVNISEASSFFGIAIFCFGICAYAFPIQENMLYTYEFSKAVIFALILVCSIYIVLGVYGAMLYNRSEFGIQGNILLNLPVRAAAGVVVRLSMALVS